MSDPGGSVDRGTVREQAARMIAETRCKAYAECMDHRYGPCPAHIEDAEDDAKALSHARLLRDDESLETENILGMMWQREKRRAASAEAERDRLRAGIEKAIEESTPDLRPVGFDGTPFPVLVPDFVLRALLAESGTPAESRENSDAN